MAHLVNKHKYYYIYKIVNIINRKCYVGFHAEDKEYENDTYYGSGKLLDAAIEKYGIENFVKGTIEYVDVENWKEKERFWIKEMKSHVSEGGYNLTFGGDGTLGLVMSPESREKIRKITTGVIQSEESKKKKSEKLKGKQFTPEHIENLKIGRAKVVITQERKDKASATQKAKFVNKENHPMFGKHHKQESKDKIGIKNKINSIGEKNPMFGKTHRKESIEKMRNAKKGKILNQHLIGKKKLKIKCPYCNKEIADGNYQRWHGENCKQKLINIK